MDSAILTAIISGSVALIVQGIGAILLRRSPLAPERQAYIGDLQGRNALLERENDDYERRLTELAAAFEAHKRISNERISKLERENASLHEEIRRLERENLEFYRRYPTAKRGGTST